jgi:hypothetical protein
MVTPFLYFLTKEAFEPSIWRVGAGTEFVVRASLSESYPFFMGPVEAKRSLSATFI